MIVEKKVIPVYNDSDRDAKEISLKRQSALSSHEKEIENRKIGRRKSGWRQAENEKERVVLLMMKLLSIYRRHGDAPFRFAGATQARKTAA